MKEGGNGAEPLGGIRVGLEEICGLSFSGEDGVEQHTRVKDIVGCFRVLSQ